MTSRLARGGHLEGGFRSRWSCVGVWGQFEVSLKPSFNVWHGLRCFDFANANAFEYYILLVGCCFTCDVSCCLVLSCLLRLFLGFWDKRMSFHFRGSAPSILAVARFFHFRGRTLSKWWLNCISDFVAIGVRQVVQHVQLHVLVDQRIHGGLCGRLQAFEASTWVSVQDVVLNSLRPSTQPSQPLPELSHFYTHKQQGNMSCSCRYGSCWCVTPWHKMMRSRQLTSFCQLHKSDQKHMSSQKVFTSRHGLFV